MTLLELLSGKRHPLPQIGIGRVHRIADDMDDASEWQVCTTCHVPKKKEEFYIKTNGCLEGRCKACARAYAIQMRAKKRAEKEAKA